MTKLASSGIVMLQLLPRSSKQGADTDKQLLPGSGKQSTDTGADKQLLPDTCNSGTDLVKQLLLPGTIQPGTATVNSTGHLPVHQVAEAHGDIVPDAEPVLPSYQPAKVVQQILADLQTGRLSSLQ